MTTIEHAAPKQLKIKYIHNLNVKYLYFYLNIFIVIKTFKTCSFNVYKTRLKTYNYRSLLPN